RWPPIGPARGRSLACGYRLGRCGAIAQTNGEIMTDTTETIRRELVKEINAKPDSREALVAHHGRVWDTVQLREEFEVIGFAAPLVVVRRKADGQKGTMM